MPEPNPLFVPSLQRGVWLSPRYPCPETLPPMRIYLETPCPRRVELSGAAWDSSCTGEEMGSGWRLIFSQLSASGRRWRKTVLVSYTPHTIKGRNSRGDVTPSFPELRAEDLRAQGPEDVLFPGPHYAWFVEPQGNADFTRLQTGASRVLKLVSFLPPASGERKSWRGNTESQLPPRLLGASRGLRARAGWRLGVSRGCKSEESKEGARSWRRVVVPSSHTQSYLYEAVGSLIPRGRQRGEAGVSLHDGAWRPQAVGAAPAALTTTRGCACPSPHS